MKQYLFIPDPVEIAILRGRWKILVFFMIFWMCLAIFSIILLTTLLVYDIVDTDYFWTESIASLAEEIVVRDEIILDYLNYMH